MYLKKIENIHYPQRTRHRFPTPSCGNPGRSPQDSSAADEAAGGCPG